MPEANDFTGLFHHTIDLLEHEELEYAIIGGVAADIILYKIFSGREIDLADIRSIVQAQRGKLDTDYLNRRADTMARELNRSDIVSTLQKYLRES